MPSRLPPCDRMLRATFLSMVLLSCATDAGAACVVIVGTSIDRDNAKIYPPYVGYPGALDTSWPTLLEFLRPDVRICNLSIDGGTTHHALHGFDAKIASITQDEVVKDVVIHHGVNDAKLKPRQAPLAVANRIRRIAARATAWGATPHILTSLPVTADNPNHPDMPWNDFVRDVGRRLAELNGVGPEYDTRPLADLELAWDSCSVDGIHPGGLAGLPCREAIAASVASWLPQQ